MSDVQLVTGPATVVAILGRLVVADATNGAVLILLPPSDGEAISVSITRADATTNAVTVGIRPTPTPYTAPLNNAAVTVVPVMTERIVGTTAITAQNQITTYTAASRVWYASPGALPQASLDARYAPFDQRLAGMRTWGAALANRLYAPADVLVIGDSISEGQGATVKNRRWQERFAANMRARYPVSGVAGGEGFIQGFYLQNSFASGWTSTGAFSGDGTLGLGHRCAVLNSPGASITRTVSGTSIKLNNITAAASGTYQVFLDGSGTAAATINTAGGATVHGGQTTTVSLGTRGTHTVKIAWSSGGFVYFNGLWVYDQDEASGIRVTDCAQYGSVSSYWSPATNGNEYELSDDITALQPALVVIELGANDRTGNVPSATYAANIQALIAQVKAACTVTPTIWLVGAYLEGTGNEPWTNYLAQLAAIAAADPTNTVFTDLTQYLPDTSNTALGLFVGDHVHPSDAGHSRIADILTSVASL